MSQKINQKRIIKLFLNYMIIRRRQWQPTPVLLPGKFHGWRSLVGCSPWGREESDTTERLHFHFSLSCIGEGNGNPTPVFLPGESQGRGSLVGCHLWGRTESDTTDATAAVAAAVPYHNINSLKSHVNYVSKIYLQSNCLQGGAYVQ